MKMQVGIEKIKNIYPQKHPKDAAALIRRIEYE